MLVRAPRAALLGVLLSASALCPAAAQTAPAPPSSDLERRMQDPAQWPMPARDYANTRYSPLDQINTGNAGQLQLAWTFSIGADRGQEAAPIIVDGIMYVVGPYDGPYPNRVFALDATTGDLKWSYAPKPEPAAKGVACCDVVNRGLAFDNGKVFLNTLDDNTVAIDAKTGKEIWHTKLGEINKGETITMAPVVAKGKVIVGNSGGELGVRGWVTALDENTGAIAWRAYATGPDKDVLIGDDFKPFYDSFKGKDLGVTSWPADRWRTGGGTMWGWVSFDPALNMIFFGTANPSPWNANQRKGDNLWSSTIFGRDIDSGHAKWAYQVSPHDLFDHDEINENVLVDLDIDGKTRKALIHPGRNGYMYVMDRTTGEVISADAYEFINAYKGVDLKTGRIIPNDEKTPVLGKTVENICPSAPGAKDWQPTAWSPRTKLLYVPHQHLCMSFRASEVGYIAGTPFVGADVDMYAGPGGYRGEFMAWDPVARKKVWEIHEKLPVWAGTLVTAGDVTFYGTMDRMFKAVNAKTGEVLWQFRAGSGFIGQPVTYRGSDGQQYVAILSGVGGWPGVVANAEVDPRVRNGALGFTGATQDLPFYTAGGSELLVFKLGNATQHATQQAPAQTTPPAGGADQDKTDAPAR
ncbi:PQQ-dependent dehydrogenase, methanol/ethanol family [Bradyrhizobium sp. ORS 375]|uniref:PQQ-dependent dehydrogenase, methanol/ethanol family n=1 Tax=Bradyrhizobium sp. (strain ORS 375) TaxID=566679 RepID=UPI000558F69C|nr:PQQ-dependent dehydrogenase, methanol/ethanol family [Bradyrhizobium sp. ORS 375]